MARGLILHPEDNVGLVLEPVIKGDKVYFPNGLEVIALNDIPFAHKISLLPFEPGIGVRKYGETIGEATVKITAGEHVHIHNIKSLRT